jgi:hypothetical protein
MVVLETANIRQSLRHPVRRLVISSRASTHLRLYVSYVRCASNGLISTQHPLAALLGQIVVAIYGIRSVSSRPVEAVNFETLLDKWYIELPEHLRHEPGSNKFSRAQPHVLTLHMQYWCTVLLLHRPL